ncbi:MAG: phytanoyl-CoA dioxygenase family protein [Candidatus Latescibacteria bacterium]|jgi:hypothetical protein|nr:phytanoyl-CoA dioxygenase family protein [Candidatus Latescibacterota bacterium]MEE3040777.1 phytanoyl-CoA dioxygenase family protein [Candidatus Latescibacterota bacterium]MEE3264238.1 phytanoyl-CoA dioxygenase family protein [Candidatus Latescibacterota bacterium]
MDDRLSFFKDNGYVVVHDALTTTEIATVNDGIDADRAIHPEHWQMGPRVGFDAVGCDAPDLLHRTLALDGMVYHPSIWSLVRSILGEGTLCSGLTFMFRFPCDADPPEDIDGGDPLCLSRQWHREDRGNVEGAQENAYFTSAIQAIYYLDDVDEGCHCTSIIPESAVTKRSLPKTTEGDVCITGTESAYVDPEKPTWIDSFGREGPRRIGRVDVHARAGSVLVFNNASLHCATIRKTARLRRALHVRYRQPEPVRSRHALKTPCESVADFQTALPDRPGIRRV